MATFSTNTQVNFFTDFGLLELLANPANYQNEWTHGFQVSDGGSTIDVGGTFNLNMGSIVDGTVSSIVLNMPGGQKFMITGAPNVDLTTLQQALQNIGPSAALQLIFEDNDFLYGSADNDVLKGYAGNDYLYGGAGGDDSLDGGAGNDGLYSGSGSDSLDGGSGNDMLWSGAGNDSLHGGAGSDTLRGDTGVDTASYSEKNAAVSVTLNGDNEVTVFVGGVAEDTIREIENVVGGDGNDALTGDDLANALSGRDGDDLLSGMGGDDMLTGGNGNDTMAGGEGADSFTGGAGADVIDGGAGADTANYSGSGGVVVALDGANAVTVFVNGAAEDTLLNVENISGGSGNDSLTGDKLANILSGNLGDDTLIGMKGNDDLRGGNGADTLSGGKGRDLLTGGDGADSFLFDAKLTKKKKHIDTIDDFAVADDTMLLDDAIFKKLDPGALEAKQFHIGKKAHDGNDRIIYNQNNGKLFYDADGKKDGFDKVLVAKLDGGLAMTHEDFFIV